MKSVLTLSDSADITRHFFNILRTFVVAGLPTHINVTKLAEYGFGSLLTYRTTSLYWNDVVQHPLRSIECAFPNINKHERKFDGVECKRAEAVEKEEEEDAIAWQIEMPLLKTVALMSDRLQQTIPYSEAIPLLQTLRSVQDEHRNEQQQSSTPLARMKSFARMLEAAGAPRDKALNNGIMKEKGGTFFRGLHRAALQQVANDMLHFPEKRAETLKENTDLLTSEIVIVCKFLTISGSDGGGGSGSDGHSSFTGSSDQVVGVHVLIDRVSVFRRGVVVANGDNDRMAKCFSIPIVSGIFGIDLCIGGGSVQKKAFVFRKYSHVGIASEHFLTVGSGEEKDITFPFTPVIGMRVVIGAQLMGIPFLSMPSATIPIHPFMSNMLANTNTNKEKLLPKICEENVDISGFDLNSVNLPDPAACRQACVNATECVAFVFRSCNDNVCWLKSDVGALRYNASCMCFGRV